MKRLIVIFVTVALCFLAGAHFLLGVAGTRSEGPVPERDKVAHAGDGLPLPPPSVRASLIPVKESEKISRECRQSWDQIRKIALPAVGQRLAGPSRDGVLAFDPGAFSEVIKKTPIEDHCKSLPSSSPLFEFNRYSLAVCQSARESLANPVLTAGGEIAPSTALKLQACYSSLVDYYDAIVAWKTRETPLSEISDPSILRSRIQFARKIGNVTEWVTTMDRLIDVSPNDVSLPREAALGVLSAWEKGRLSEPAEGARLSQKYLEILSKLDPDDSSIPQIKMTMARNGKDYVAMRELASAASDRDPSLGNYYLAWASYLSGDAIQAKSYLNKVLASNPNYALAKLALHQISGGAPSGANQEVFVDPLVASQP